MTRQSKKLSMEELRRQNIIKSLRSYGIEKVGEQSLHSLDVQELKWHLALEMAKRED